jgi:hypothetical protein
MQIDVDKSSDTAQEKLVLQLPMEDVNLILKALGNLPFNQVYDLIGKIHQQANEQLFEK